MSFHSSLLFACFVCYSHWFLLLYSLCGEVTYHQVLDLLRSQLFLWKLSTAACAKAHILLERVRLTCLYTRLPCKKKKRILSAEVFLYHAVVSRSGKPGQNQCRVITHTPNFFFRLSDADFVRLNGSLSEAAEWILIPDIIQRLLIFYHYHHDFLLEFYVTIKCVCTVHPTWNTLLYAWSIMQKLTLSN